jgi:hypothetical protein
VAHVTYPIQGTLRTMSAAVPRLTLRPVVLVSVLGRILVSPSLSLEARGGMAPGSSTGDCDDSRRSCGHAVVSTCSATGGFHVTYAPNEYSVCSQAYHGQVQ